MLAAALVLPLVFEPSGTGFIAKGKDFRADIKPAQFTVYGGRHAVPFQLTFSGANTAASARPTEKMPGVSHYFQGSTRRLNVANYGGAGFTGLYRGIDIAYHAANDDLEYDLIVHPGADPKAIRLQFQERPALDSQGDLVVGREFRHRRPVAHQTINGVRRNVEVSYAITGREVRFELGIYDRRHVLVIDPVIRYANYLGIKGEESGFKVSTDKDGNVYVAGITGLTAPDVFVTKLNVHGTVLFTTVLAGAGLDVPVGVAADTDGYIFAAGRTESQDFPTLNPLQSCGGGFITKLSPTGDRMVFSTCWGSGAVIRGFTLDPQGNPIIVGSSKNSNFPLYGQEDPSPGSGDLADVLVAKFTSSGSAAVFSVRIGGTEFDQARAVRTDLAGNIYVTGMTLSSGFPVLNALNPSHRGSWDAFVLKMSGHGSVLASTFLGGGSYDEGMAIAVDSTGRVTVSGETDSSDFPTRNAHQPGPAPGRSNFVTRFTPDLRGYEFSTYFGPGASYPRDQDIAVDEAGNLVIGFNSEGVFPITKPATYFGSCGYIARFTAGGRLLFAEQIVGANFGGVAMDRGGQIYITGDSSGGLEGGPPLTPFTNNAYVVAVPYPLPAAAFLDSYGALQILSSVRNTPVRAGGVFAGKPAAARDAAGNTIVAARDRSGGYWMNRFLSHTQTWERWIYVAGIFQGDPALALGPNGSVLLAGRDERNSYWIYEATGFGAAGTWRAVGGPFVSDPVLAANGAAAYLVGRDALGATWASSGQSFTNWRNFLGKAEGKPAAAVDSTGNLYVAIRDHLGAYWMHAAGTWFYGQGVFASDPQMIVHNDVVQVAGLSPTGNVWQASFTPGVHAAWQPWTSPGGVLHDLGISDGPDQVFLVGRGDANQIWWYESPGAGWRLAGYPGLAAGAVSASR